MSKIGLILAQKNEIGYLADCLESWISYRKNNDLLIVALDVCFAETDGGNSTDGSLELLEEYKRQNKIDHFEALKPGLKEHEARNVGLKWLLDKGVDLIISVGSDEIFKETEIKQIFDYVEKDKLTAVFKIHYKNYVNDKLHYILGFKPNRIWRVNYNKFKISEFFYDDDIRYLGKNSVVIDRDLPSKVIPNVMVNHFSWLNDERSRAKILYQEIHFKPPIGLGCSYQWKNGEVVFNTEYYKKSNQPLPEIIFEPPIYDTPYGRFVLDPKDGVCRNIERGDFWDEWIKPHILDLPKDAVCIDIGSHVGFLTVYMAKNCKHVHSFEPQKISYDRLVKNVSINGLSNVSCCNVALYDKSTKMNVNNIKKQSNVDYNNCQACSLSLFEDPEGDIEAKTLDSFNLGKIDFIKIDAENSEPFILQGGIETIKKYRPLIIFEWGGNNNVPHKILSDLQYNTREIAGQNFLATPM